MSSKKADEKCVKLEERIVYAYGGKGGDALTNEVKSEGSFIWRTVKETVPQPPPLSKSKKTSSNYLSSA